MKHLIALLWICLLVMGNGCVASGGYSYGYSVAAPVYVEPAPYVYAVPCDSGWCYYDRAGVYLYAGPPVARYASPYYSAHYQRELGFAPRPAYREPMRPMQRQPVQRVPASPRRAPR